MNGLYGTTSESTGLYGVGPATGGTYFEWIIFQDALTQPTTPTGGTWDFQTNTGTAPAGWLSAPIANPTQYVWTSIAIVDSRSSTLTWSTPGVLATQGATAGANSNITSLAGITGGISSPTFLQLNTSGDGASAVGKIKWEPTFGGPTIGLAGGNTNLQIGQDEFVYVYNNTGSTITKGQVVYVSGSQGQRVTVGLAQANADATSISVLGFANESIANNSSGFVASVGLVSGINTSGFADGASIWLSPSVAGGFTTTKTVAPNHLVLLGYVVKGGSAGAGSIFVFIQNGYELDELHDVKITSASNGQTLKYDSSIPAWVNTSQMVIDSSGNVGIGTSSPENKLDVNGGISVGSITARAFGGEGGQLSLNNTTNTGTAYNFDVDTGNHGRLFTTQNNTNLTLGQLVGTGGVVAIYTSGAEKMRIDSAGNVGIGTSSPQGLLHVVAGTDNTVLVRGPVNLGTGGSIYAVNSSNSVVTPLEFGASVYSFAGGNVGIGTSSPTAKLDVDTDTVRVRSAKTPASATAAGNAGDICWDSNYVYVCVATNTWKRSAIATW